MQNKKKLISIISPCYNEESNIEKLYEEVIAELDKLPEYEFEYVFIDNASTDNTVKLLKSIASIDKRVKLIVNTRNFGHLRSPYYGLLQTNGVATIYLASDLQDPPAMIPQLIRSWELGAKVVFCTKPTTNGNKIMHLARKFYYTVLDLISDVPQVRDATGFGIYDKVVLDIVRAIDDPYPYFRGMICELGFKIETIKFTQPRRLAGISKNNFYTLYDYAMLGITSHSLVPIRIAGMIGFILGGISLCLALALLFLKLIFWEEFPMGFAPFGIAAFMMFGGIFFFIGILGEYIGVIHTHVLRRPIVVEKERINFN